MRIELLDEYSSNRPGLTPIQPQQVRRLPSGFVLLATQDRGENR